MMNVLIFIGGFLAKAMAVGVIAASGIAIYLIYLIESRSVVEEA
jgi:hypothetical protein